MSSPITRARPGPRPQGPFEDKRKNLTTRITEKTRSMLEAAASGTGRSLSQEIEFRLEQSLREDADRVRLYGGPDLDALFKQIAGAIGIIEQTRGKRWRQDQKTFMSVIGAFKEVLAQI